MTGMGFAGLIEFAVACADKGERDLVIHDSMRAVARHVAWANKSELGLFVPGGLLDHQMPQVGSCQLSCPRLS